MKIVESEDWPTYRSVWIECMKDYYWYKHDPVFDWNKNEELDEMEGEFGKPGNVFLEAHQDDNIIGVFGFRHRGRNATLRRWEPGIINSTYDLTIHNALLSHALDYLSEKGVTRVRVLIKHPAKNPEVAKYLMDLFKQCEFNRYQPDSVDLVTRLDDIPEPPPMNDDISIDSETELSPEALGEYIIRAYGTTPDDLEIHGFDQSVTDYDTAVAAFGSIMSGRLGQSPEEFYKVAFVNGEHAGFIGGFIKESKHRPLTGILGPLGVFPEYRRLGLGVYLVSELFKSMKSHGCEYTGVGTPLANTNATKMYEKAGYKLNCILIHLEKTI
ncbi:MAG: GNAT family N-acetyltransferase [Candidatus Thorarchaeota archaeon]